MPYIPAERRALYERYDQVLPPENGADLNYVLSMIVARFTEYQGLSYDTISAARAALSGALAEYDRCVVGPYEQGKREANGDVWANL